MKRAGLAAFVALALVACGAQPRTPGDVVTLYFASLGRDPMRSLPITTEAFHLAHGLDLATSSETRVDRAQVAWLAIQNRADFARIASELAATATDVREAGDVATVTVTVTGAQAAPFLQTFRLTRDDPASPWRIDAIEQSGATSGEVAAFVAHPTESARRAIERRVQATPRPDGSPR